jgi:hypothetical protein
MNYFVAAAFCISFSDARVWFRGKMFARIAS